MTTKPIPFNVHLNGKRMNYATCNFWPEANKLRSDGTPPAPPEGLKWQLGIIRGGSSTRQLVLYNDPEPDHKYVFAQWPEKDGIITAYVALLLPTTDDTGIKSWDKKTISQFHNLPAEVGDQSIEPVNFSLKYNF
jgi:hypothetical protein